MSDAHDDGRRLVEQALLRRDVERIPCFPLVDVVYAGAFSGITLAEAQLNPTAHARALTQCIDRLPIDGVYINLCFSREQAARAAPRAGGYQVLLDDCLEVQIGANDVASIVRTQIDSLEDPRLSLAELFHPGMLETFRAVPAEAQDRAAVCMGLTGAFSQVGFLVGLERLLVALVDQPERVHRALRLRQEVALRQAEDLCRAGARFIWIGEGMASGSLISPTTYREFVLPYERELVARIRELGALSLLHICGNTTKMLGEMAETGADGCDVDSPTDWAAAVSVLGRSMCVKGNVNPLLFLPGNMHQLASACAEAKRVASGLRGFILSTGCLVPRDSTADAFEVMWRACQPARAPGH
jgi:MtaA/CmuA family methyltransferase